MSLGTKKLTLDMHFCVFLFKVIFVSIKIVCALSLSDVAVTEYSLYIPSSGCETDLMGLIARQFSLLDFNKTLWLKHNVNFLVSNNSNKYQHA